MLNLHKIFYLNKSCFLSLVLFCLLTKNIYSKSDGKNKLLKSSNYLVQNEKESADSILDSLFGGKSDSEDEEKEEGFACKTIPDHLIELPRLSDSEIMEKLKKTRMDQKDCLFKGIEDEINKLNSSREKNKKAIQDICKSASEFYKNCPYDNYIIPVTFNTLKVNCPYEQITNPDKIELKIKFLTSAITLGKIKYNLTTEDNLYTSEEILSAAETRFTQDETIGIPYKFRQLTNLRVVTKTKDLKKVKEFLLNGKILSKDINLTKEKDYYNMNLNDISKYNNESLPACKAARTKLENTINQYK